MTLIATTVARHLPLLLCGLIGVAWLITAALWRRGAPSPTSQWRIVALAIALFGLLATMPPAVVAWDQAIAEAMRTQVPRPQLEAAYAITWFGNFETLVVIGGIVALALAACQRRSDLALWVVVTLVNGLLNRLLKHGFERTRPLHDHGLVIEPAYSFPSGHASGALAVYGLLAILLMPHLAPAARLPVLLATTALVLMVGASRVILHVHFASDVLAGYASALAVVVAGHALRERSLRRAAR